MNRKPLENHNSEKGQEYLPAGNLFPAQRDTMAGPVRSPAAGAEFRCFRCFVCLIALFLGTRGAIADGPGTNSLAGLRQWLDQHLGDDRFKAAAWGVKIVSLASNQTVYEHNAGKLLKPASNTKLYSGALALDRLGPEYRIRTSLYARTSPNERGEVDGDLVVYGRGDPSFAARFNNGGHVDNLRPVSRALAAAGVKRVRGDLIADESHFRGPPLGSGWMWDDLVHYYGAEVSALTVEDNVVDLVFKPGDAVGDPMRIVTLPRTSYVTFSNRVTTVGAGEKQRIWMDRPLGGNLVYLRGQLPITVSNVYDAVTVHQPAMWFGTLLRESFGRHSIEVDGGVRSIDWLGRELEPMETNEWKEIASVESPPLKEILGRMMKPSQNLYAHLLLLQVGAQVMQTNTTFRTTEDAGLLEMGRFMEELAIRKGEVLLEEGSGLSRGTLLTPNATVALLAHMASHPHRDTFRDSLPVAGVDGTLRRRMKSTPADGNARAKTGTLRYVFALSGYVTTKTGEELAYSLMLNNYDSEEGDARRALDDIVVRLAGLEERL